MLVRSDRSARRMRAAALVILVGGCFVACTDAEEREPLGMSADAGPAGVRPDSMPPTRPMPDGPIVPSSEPDAATAHPADAAVSVAPVPEDAALPWDGAAPSRDEPSLEPVDAGIRDEMDTPSSDPDRPSCNGPSDCGPTQFCFFSRLARCGAEDTPGHCTERPIAGSCATAMRTVCGCDGHTYPNACHAWESGSDVAADGACM